MKIRATYRNNATLIEISEIDSTLTEGQQGKAAEFGATHYFKTNDCVQLPKYVDAAIREGGWTYTKIGWTSYESSTWGAKKA